MISMLVYTVTSAYTTPRSRSTRCTRPTPRSRCYQERRAEPPRPAAGRQTATLPDGLGTVTFDGVQPLTEAADQPHTRATGRAERVALALIGLLASLFIRPRRIWVRARNEGGRTLVEVAGLDRRRGGDLTDGVDDLRSRFAPAGAHRQTHSTGETRRDPLAVRAAQQPGGAPPAAVVYFLAVLAHLAQWALARKVEVATGAEEVVASDCRRRAAIAPTHAAWRTTSPSVPRRCSAGSAWR